MAGQTNLAVRIATIFDAAGINKADKSISKLEKNAKKLGKTLGIALSVATVAAFGKASVKAFAADEKSAAMLTIAIKNLGLAFEQANVDKFISDLERTSAIADDVLRPAFQGLLTTTGSVAKAQQLLNTAIETSRGSGIDLATVAQDLSNAYAGNTRGIRKYNLGLTQAELKTMSFTEIMVRLNKQFDGSSAAYLETYAGKMEAITTAVGAAQEVIGSSLVNALITLTGAANTTELITYIENVGQRIADLITSVEKFGFMIRYWFNPKNWLKKGDSGAKEWEELLRKRAYAASKAFDPKNNAVTGFKLDQAAAQKAIKDAAKRQKELLASQNKQTAELKKQAALKKAGTVFDLEQIQIVAALKGKLTEEEKIRLQAQLALLNGNADVATRLTNQILAAQDSSGNLARFLAALPNAKNPFEYLDAYLSYLAGKAAAVLTGTTAPNVPSTTASAAAMPTPSEMAASGSFSQLVSQGAGASGGFSPVVAAAMQPQVIELKITGDGDLTNTIAKNLMQQSLSTGNQTYVNRRTGGFE
jgi:hypothetical protein